MRAHPSKKPKKAPLTIIVIACVVLVAAGITYLYILHPFDAKESSNTESPSGASNATNPDTKQTTDSSDTTQETPTRVEDKTPTQYEGESSEAEYDDERFRIPEGE